jgi:hypothetical protein
MMGMTPITNFNSKNILLSGYRRKGNIYTVGHLFMKIRV